VGFALSEWEKEQGNLAGRTDDLIRHVGSFETDSGLPSSAILAPAHRLDSTNDNSHTAGRQASAPDKQALAPDRQVLALDSRQALAPHNRNLDACGRPWPAKLEIRGPTWLLPAIMPITSVW